MRKIRNAYRGVQKYGAVPWEARILMATAFEAMFILAAIGQPLISWILVGVFSVIWYGILFAGIWEDIKDYGDVDPAGFRREGEQHS